MLNKKYIIGGVIILVIIAGAVFFSRNNSSTPDASVLEKGVKNLTRESAAKMIKTSFEVRPEISMSLGKAAGVNYDETSGNYSFEFSLFGVGFDKSKLPELEKAGFIKMSGGKEGLYGELYFQFTEQAEPYWVRPMDEKAAYTVLAELASVEVTGITEATEKDGKTVRIADFIAKFKPTPIGVINNEKKAAEDIKTQAQFILYDDGWRIAQ